MKYGSKAMRVEINCVSSGSTQNGPFSLRMSCPFTCPNKEFSFRMFIDKCRLYTDYIQVLCRSCCAMPMLRMLYSRRMRRRFVCKAYPDFLSKKVRALIVSRANEARTTRENSFRRKVNTNLKIFLSGRVASVKQRYALQKVGCLFHLTSSASA